MQTKVPSGTSAPRASLLIEGQAPLSFGHRVFVRALETYLVGERGCVFFL